MKHVVITGGSGFVGSHLTDRFLVSGYAVTVLDNLVTGDERNLSDAKENPHFEFLKWDVTEPLPKSIRKPDGVLHFACPASPVDFDRIPFEILKVGSLGTMHTLDLAMRNDARYLLASTSEVYGDPLQHPQKESYWGNVNSAGPRSCYDETKRFSEAYVTSAMSGRGVYQGQTGYKPANAAIVRIFNTYGPRMRPDDGRVIPEFCRQVLVGEDLTVHGAGKQTRSFCYVSDLVDGIFRLYESSHQEIVNIGNPTELSVEALAQKVIDLAKGKSGIRRIGERPDDPRTRQPDITKAKELLDWEPQVLLEAGLEKTLEYFRTRQ